jgi:amidohydrolase
MTNIISDKVESITQEIINIRRFFHQHPELQLQEYATSKKISEILSEWGIENTIVAETGVVGLLKGSKPGRTVALRADIDALPIYENTNLKFASKNEGVMHACGHDGHIAICLGAAKILSEMTEHLTGTVKLIFQPAEELPGGAAHMIKAGVLENPNVDAIVGLHIWPDIPKGTVGITQGPIMSAVDRFDLTILGKGGHGAMPHKAIDPIAAGTHFLTSLQTILNRETDAFDRLVISPCSFNSGNSFNVIPEKAEISGTVRYFDSTFQNLVPRRMEELISGITHAFRCDYQFDYTHLCPVVKNDSEITNYLEQATRKMLGQEKILRIDRPALGGEDFSFYLEKIPGAFFFLGTKDEIKGYTNSLHHPKFDFDEEIIPIGIKAFTSFVFEYLM